VGGGGYLRREGKEGGDGIQSKRQVRICKKKIKQTQITKFNSRRQKDKEVRSVREIGIIQREIGRGNLAWFVSNSLTLFFCTGFSFFPVCRCADVYIQRQMHD
jgi:hypothetical protein